MYMYMGLNVTRGSSFFLKMTTSSELRCGIIEVAYSALEAGVS